jgi:LicD family
MELLRSILTRLVDKGRRQQLRRVFDRWKQFGLARYCPWLLQSRSIRFIQSLMDQLKLGHAFRPRWTSVSLAETLRLVNVVNQVFRETGLSYMAYAGTLLGIERHAGVIPWDDDVDFCIEGCDLPKLLSLHDRLAILGIRLIATELCYKLCWSRKRSFDRRDWSWPFIDVFVWDKINGRLLIRSAGDHYPGESVFPLRDARFHHLMLPVPRDSRAVLATWYGPDFMHRAVSPTFLHRKEEGIHGKPFMTTYPLPSWRSIFSRQYRTPRQLCDRLFRSGVSFLRSCGVEFWADFGTLLGAYRDRSLLPHEHNIDFSIMEESVPRLIRNLNRLDRDFEFRDTTRYHHGPKFEITHRKFGGTCDLYTYRRLENRELRICLGDRWHGTMDARDIPEEIIFPLQSTRIDGVLLMRPRQVKEYLIHRYGYLGYPAVLNDDGSGHYRGFASQEPLRASKLTASGTILVDLGDSLSAQLRTSE